MNNAVMQPITVPFTLWFHNCFQEAQVQASGHVFYRKLWRIASNFPLLTIYGIFPSFIFGAQALHNTYQHCNSVIFHANYVSRDLNFFDKLIFSVQTNSGKLSNLQCSSLFSFPPTSLTF